MKFIVLLAALLGAAAPALAQPSVGCPIGINQPGVYGRIHIGDVPRRRSTSRSRSSSQQPRVVVERQPIYLYVPPAHQQNWRRYCGRYQACGQPVYFVRDEWVRERYEHEHPGWNRGRHRGWDKHDKHDKHGKHASHDDHDKKDKHRD